MGVIYAVTFGGDRLVGAFYNLGGRHVGGSADILETSVTNEYRMIHKGVKGACTVSESGGGTSSYLELEAKNWHAIRGTLKALGLSYQKGHLRKV